MVNLILDRIPDRINAAPFPLPKRLVHLAEPLRRNLPNPPAPPRRLSTPYPHHPPLGGPACLREGSPPPLPRPPPPRNRHCHANKSPRQPRKRTPPPN